MQTIKAKQDADLQGPLSGTKEIDSKLFRGFDVDQLEEGINPVKPRNMG